MAITEDRVDQTATLADLLGRVEALEAQQDASIQKKNKITIIAWGGNLDRIWPTTDPGHHRRGRRGMEASVFFTFWGLFAIVKPGVRITGDNWMQKMMSVMNPGSAQKAKLSHYQFLGAGPAMFKKLADNNNVAKPDELIALAQDLGVRLIPCQMTMDLLGLKHEDLLDGLEEPIGAATAHRARCARPPSRCSSRALDGRRCRAARSRSSVRRVRSRRHVRSPRPPRASVARPPRSG